MFLKIIVAVFVFMNIFFFLALIKKKFSVVDIAWGLGFVLIAFISYFEHPLSTKNALLLLTTSAWGLRLGLYILVRSKGAPEDPRYTKLRNEWKPNENLQAYLKVFLLQGFLMCIVSLPVSIGMIQSDRELEWYNYLGLIIWILGFSLEVWSDLHLANFKKKPENKGKLCTTGPWKISRYPNYLGEISLWYGVYFIALGHLSWWTIVGPVVINLMILKVSGIPPQEEREIERKRPEYADYARRVPRLLPFKTPNNTRPPWEI